MRKMLAIVSSVVLTGAAFLGTARATEPPDRSALSYEENATINAACATVAAKGADAFNECVMRQLVGLRDHPTPDRSQLSASRNRAIERNCAYLRHDSVAAYNDCLRKAMAGPDPEQTPEQKASSDEFMPNYTKIFTENATAKPQPIPVAAAALPAPGEILSKRPDHVGQKALTAAELYKKVERSVFVVLASPSLGEARVRNIMQGSAIAISDHLLLTNCHVVKDRPLIKLMQEGARADATLVAADVATDRCVIKTADITLAPIAGVRTMESLAIGEHVFAVGAPRSLERTLSEGLISGLRPGRGRNLVQTSAPVSPGSSGGGLFDERGNLVGITTLGSIAGSQNLNFAIAAADFWK